MFGDLISKMELEAMDVWGDTVVTLEDFLTSNAGPVNELLAPADIANVYIYDDVDSWVTVQSADYAEYDLDTELESLSYFVFELNGSASGKSIRFEEED